MLGVFLIELVAPFGIFTNRVGRRVTAAATILLMLLIMITGNYAYFNVLTIALALSLLDDGDLKRLLPALSRLKIEQKPAGTPVASPTQILVVTGATLIFLAASASLLERVGLSDQLPPPLLVLDKILAPLHISGQYGLFAVMTTTRREIIIEGSDDGKTWQAYEFPFKPGDLFRAPPIVAPHQPRLDWQMWFAALGNAGHSPWLQPLMARLLQGQPAMLRLFARNPFPDHPPKYVRAHSYVYSFSSPENLFSHGQWWERSEEARYFPPAHL